MTASEPLVAAFQAWIGEQSYQPLALERERAAELLDHLARDE